MKYRWVGDYIQDFGALTAGPGDYIELDEVPQEYVDAGLMIEAGNVQTEAKPQEVTQTQTQTQAQDPTVQQQPKGVTS